MENSQNTPPHAEFHIVIERDMKIDSDGHLSNSKIDLKGCKECLREAFVFLLLEKPGFKEFFNSVIREANRRKAQN